MVLEPSEKNARCRDGAVVSLVLQYRVCTYKYNQAYQHKHPNTPAINPQAALQSSDLFVIFFGGSSSGARLASLSGATGNTTGASTTERRSQGKVDQLLGVQADNETGDVDHLFTDANVALADEDAGVVDALGESELENLSLQATLQEIFNLQAQDVIQLGLGVVEDTDADETTDEGVSFEEAAGVTLGEGQELTGGFADFGEGEGDAVDFGLVAETVLTGELDFVVETGFDERTTRNFASLGV